MTVCTIAGDTIYLLVRFMLRNNLKIGAILHKELLYKYNEAKKTDDIKHFVGIDTKTQINALKEIMYDNV
jgi:hypothetical protein